MKTMVPVRVQLAGLALGAVVVGAVTAVAVSSRRESAAEDEAARDEVADLRRLDSALNEEILKARFGLSPHYDAVSSTQREIERRAGNGLPLQGEVDAPIRAAKDEFLKELAKKGNLIEQVKFDRAAARNSAQYFPTLVDEARARMPPLSSDEKASVDGVAHRALALALAPSDENAAALKSAIEQLPATEAPKGEGLENLRLHAGKIHLGYTFENRLERALAMKTQAKLNVLDAAYSARHNAKEADNLRFLVGLAFLASGLLVAVAWVLRRLAVMNTSARRFVPYEFLNMLGKTSLADIKRGDAVRVEMSVLFADIRDFTTRSERRSPEENFKFMNEYLGAMEVPIHEHAGFVNQYLGDGIMALFPQTADGAVKAARGMFDALEALNARLGEDAVRIGIGMNTGSLMLGTLGGRDRMNAGVISDAVNLAARVEGLTKLYGVRMLLTDNTRTRIGETKGISLRTVDRVQVKGTQRPILIFQLVDVEPDHRAEALLMALPTHERAMQLYFDRRFAEAEPLFQQVMGAVPGDRVSEILIGRCRGFVANPPLATWDGAERLDNK